MFPGGRVNLRDETPPAIRALSLKTVRNLFSVEPVGQLFTRLYIEIRVLRRRTRGIDASDLELPAIFQRQFQPLAYRGDPAAGSAVGSGRGRTIAGRPRPEA